MTYVILDPDGRIPRGADAMEVIVCREGWVACEAAEVATPIAIYSLAALVI